MNAQLAYMLEDKDMFNISEGEIGTKVSELTVISVPASMVATFFVSYVLEIWGRRNTIAFGYLTTAGVFFLLPYSAPSYTALIVLRSLIGITMAGPLANPLIADYVKKNSRGKAIALSGVGMVMGEVFSMGILFNITKNMNFFDAFAIASGVIFLFSIFFFWAIKEPDLQTIRDAPNSRHYKVNTPHDFGTILRKRSNSELLPVSSKLNME